MIMMVNIKCGICRKKLARWKGEKDPGRMMKFLSKIQALQRERAFHKLHYCIGAIAFYDVYSERIEHE